MLFINIQFELIIHLATAKFTHFIINCFANLSCQALFPAKKKMNSTLLFLSSCRNLIPNSCESKDKRQRFCMICIVYINHNANLRMQLSSVFSFVLIDLLFVSDFYPSSKCYLPKWIIRPQAIKPNRSISQILKTNRFNSNFNTLRLLDFSLMLWDFLFHISGSHEVCLSNIRCKRATFFASWREQLPDDACCLMAFVQMEFAIVRIGLISHYCLIVHHLLLYRSS